MDADDFLGLEHTSNRLRDYAPEWDALYRIEEERLRDALGEFVVDIQHYGSTSVPGLKAKPILDILVGIARFEDGPACIPLMERLGYDYAPNAGIPGDYTFGKNVNRTHLAHVVEYGSANWRDNLFFRDRLRADPALAAAYETLKLDLSHRYPDNRAAYTVAKSEFVRQVLETDSGRQTPW